MWNGEIVKVPRVNSPDVRVQAALPDGTDGSTALGVDGLVRQIRVVFTDLWFNREVGLLIGARYAALSRSLIGSRDRALFGVADPDATTEAGQPLPHPELIEHDAQVLFVPTW